MDTEYPRAHNAQERKYSLMWVEVKAQGMLQPCPHHSTVAPPLLNLQGAFSLTLGTAGCGASLSHLV